jgi:hypothetical protein
VLSPEDRQRFAFALEHVHGVQHLYIAAVPRGEPVAGRQLRLDDYQVVYECSLYMPRS